MTDLIKFEEVNAQLISSRQIAEATGKRHQLVLSDIRKMCKDAEVEITSNVISFDVNTQAVTVVEHEYTIEIGQRAKRKSKEYILNPMATELLATGYDVKRRLKVLQLLWKIKTNLTKQIETTVEALFAEKLKGMKIVPALPPLENGFSTISGWAEKYNINIKSKTSAIGKLVTAYSKKYGYPILKVESNNGSQRPINSYCNIVLEEKFMGKHFRRTK